MFRKLTTRERRTEPGDRGRRRKASKEFRTSHSFLSFFFFSIISLDLLWNNSSPKYHRSCQESSFGRAVARARRGTLSQHSGSPPSLIALNAGHAFRLFYEARNSKVRFAVEKYRTASLNSWPFPFFDRTERESRSSSLAQIARSSNVIINPKRQLIFLGNTKISCTIMKVI